MMACKVMAMTSYLSPCSSRTVGLPLCALVVAMASPGAFGNNQAGTVFNEQFLNIGGDQPSADLSVFSFGNRVLPGTYTVDTVLNDSNIGQNEVRFNKQADDVQDATPCLTPALLDGWGVKTSVFPALANSSPETCVDLGKVIAQATVSYDAGNQRLFLSIPQAALKRSARGAISPDRWDKGINAAMLDYQLSFSRYDGNNLRGNTVSPVQQNVFDSTSAPNKLERDTYFGGLRGGFNIDDWRFRHFSTYNRSLDGQGRWQAINTYLQRDIAAIRGQLLIGDGNTPGNFFDSVQFRGVQVSSDDAMLPDSQQGYAPTIRGVAQTNARVEVRQNGYLIYSTYVAPGPFVLDDLYPTSSSGDLEVIITESDGRETRYAQAFSAVPTLLREGTWRYSATAGQYRSGYGSSRGKERPTLVQGTLARGLAQDFSIYGGTILADKYQSALSGVGKNLRSFGALSFDISHARTTDRDDQTFNGQSVRFLYAKTFEKTNTNFRVAGYRYSTSDYRTLQEAVQMQDVLDGRLFNNRRNELRFELAQSLGQWGTLHTSARQQSYWNSNSRDRLVQIGYSGSYQKLNFNLFYNHSTHLDAASNRQLMLTLSIPLGDTRASAQYMVMKDNNDQLLQQASVYGSALDDNRLTYNVTGDDSNQSGSSSSANMSYLSSIGRLDLGRSQGRGYGQTTVGMAGGVLVHGDGLTLSQPLGETIALAQAPKANDVGFEIRPGVRTDKSGDAVIPNLSPYRVNRLALLTGDLDDEVEVKNAALDVVPTRGAVVKAKFATSVGYRLMMTLANKDGSPLPFGSKIENELGQEVGIVGPEGQAFITGAGEKGNLRVMWGRSEKDQCTVSYQLPKEKSPLPIRELKGQCG